MYVKQGSHLLLLLYRPLGLAAATAGLPSALGTAAAAGLALDASSNLAHLPSLHGDADCGPYGSQPVYPVKLYSWKALSLGFQRHQSGLHHPMLLRGACAVYACWHSPSVHMQLRQRCKLEAHSACL